MKEGDVIFESEVFSHVINPDIASQVCDYCLYSLDTTNITRHNKSLNRCSKCQVVYYCDKRCQAGGWGAHKVECNFISSVKPHVPPPTGRFDTLMTHEEDIKKDSVRVEAFAYYLKMVYMCFGESAFTADFVFKVMYMDAEGEDLADQEYPAEKKPRLTAPDSTTSSLCWTDRGGQITMDNSGEVVAKMAAIYAERLMSDVLLVVGDEELPAHRLILCASSDVFQVMFMDPKWTESQEKKIELKESPECAAVFETFLKYLYTGKVCVDFANVIPLLQLADKYNVTDLLNVGLDFMSRNVPQAGNKNQVVSWFQFTTNCGYANVASLCLDFIKWNYSTVCESIDWQAIEAESLVALLHSSDIVVHDEMVIFTSVQKWLSDTEARMVREGENNIHLHLERLTQATVSCVRFPMMTPSQVADLLLSPLTKQHMGFMVERMSGAMAYHRNRESAVATILKWKNGDRMLTPRLYTEDKYCANLSIDYFSQLPMYHCRSLYFSAFEAVADYAGESQTDWMIDIYPKGVWIQKCHAIFTSGAMKEVPDKVLTTVRASVSMKECTEKRVKIGILINANENGYEHIGHARTANYIFSKDDQIVNFDNLLEFGALNDRKFKSKFLSGPNRDSLKIYVTITPLHKLGSLVIP